MNISLNFRVAVNADKDTVSAILSEDYEVVPTVGKTVEISGNFMQCKANDDYDEGASQTGEDSFLYYMSNLDFFTSNSALEIQEQVLFAKSIRQSFVQRNIDAEIIAEFEHLL
jgi:hypothetical protein